MCINAICRILSWEDLCPSAEENQRAAAWRTYVGVNSANCYKGKIPEPKNVPRRQTVGQ